MTVKARIIYKGGKGSGNFGHSGRPGKVGGSGGGSGASSLPANVVVATMSRKRKLAILAEMHGGHDYARVTVDRRDATMQRELPDGSIVTSVSPHPQRSMRGRNVIHTTGGGKYTTTRNGDLRMRLGVDAIDTFDTYGNPVVAGKTYFTPLPAGG